jgi:hypothetical protein
MGKAVDHGRGQDVGLVLACESTPPLPGRDFAFYYPMSDTKWAAYGSLSAASEA